MVNNNSLRWKPAIISAIANACGIACNGFTPIPLNLMIVFLVIGLIASFFVLKGGRIINIIIGLIGIFIAIIGFISVIGWVVSPTP